jgi:hypothetical protein
MKAREKYTKVFGEINSLAHPISWTTGISNMLEWLLWGTGNVLGVTKTQYRKRIVDWCLDELNSDISPGELNKRIEKQINIELASSERLSRYEKPGSGIASPREALRRAKYFSEDYLNKEFDIFWTLVSDQYLDTFYGQHTNIRGGGQWFTHGNSGLFATSTNIGEMHMDNLSYCPEEGLLVANELKLGGKKNPDQMLKYALMFRLLRERGFIEPETRFLLLFIGDKEETDEWSEVLEREIEYCSKSTKSTAELALDPKGIRVAREAQYATTTWSKLLAFNDEYLSTVDIQSAQVEHKLLVGFNESLSTKSFMR